MHMLTHSTDSPWLAWLTKDVASVTPAGRANLTPAQARACVCVHVRVCVHGCSGVSWAMRVASAMQRAKGHNSVHQESCKVFPARMAAHTAARVCSRLCCHWQSCSRVGPAYLAHPHAAPLAEGCFLVRLDGGLCLSAHSKPAQRAHALSNCMRARVLAAQACLLHRLACCAGLPSMFLRDLCA